MIHLKLNNLLSHHWFSKPKFAFGCLLIPLGKDGEGSSVQTCVVDVPTQFARIKEIESCFELKQKHDVKRSNPRPDTRFNLKWARLQSYNPIQLDY